MIACQPKAFGAAWLPGRRTWARCAGEGWRLLGAPLAATAAAFAKETGLVVVGLVVARDLLAGGDERRAAPRCGAVCVVSGAGLYLVVRWRVLESLGMPGTPFLENSIASAPPLERVATAFVVLAEGLQLLVAPVTLSPVYSYTAITPVTAALDARLITRFVMRVISSHRPTVNKTGSDEPEHVAEHALLA